MSTAQLSPRDTAQILAALRLWQREDDKKHWQLYKEFDGIFDDYSPLDTHEIDALCERLGQEHEIPKWAESQANHHLHLMAAYRQITGDHGDGDYDDLCGALRLFRQWASEEAGLDFMDAALDSAEVR